MKTQLYFPLLLLITLLLACLPQRPSPVEEPTATPESVSPQPIPTEAPTPTVRLSAHDEAPPPTAVPLAYAIAALEQCRDKCLAVNLTDHAAAAQQTINELSGQ
ncbi:MAG: hypothetical protein E3J21_00440 [Anaerolineales bacterium]|nr:MAG: hypothetical protein E3J21_00440 [Anaerolineales bacterium]